MHLYFIQPPPENPLSSHNGCYTIHTSGEYETYAFDRRFFPTSLFMRKL